MKFNRMICFLIVVSSISASVGMMDFADSADAVPDGTKENPYVRNLSIYQGDCEYAYLAFNLSSFDFEFVDDGYILDIIPSTVTERTVLSFVVDSQHTMPGWSDEELHVLELSNGTVDLTHVDGKGLFCFKITMLGTTRILFDVRITVTSYGVAQTVCYRFIADPIVPANYSITFDKPTVDLEGAFTAQGTLYLDGNPVQLPSNYKFFAKGLYRGISIHNDLTISGRVDLTDTKWSSGVMHPTIAVSKLTDDRVAFVNTNIEYTMENTVPGLNFKIYNGEEVVLDQSKPLAPININAGTDLSLYVSGGSRATILFEDEGELKETTVFTNRLTSETRSILTSGVGTYTILFSHMYSDQVAQVQIHIIASLVPINNIGITCKPSY